MMAQEPRIVAELGRPETAEETAARKAESSRVYRASQNTRNLIAALLVTLAVVAVVIFAVPRGEPPVAPPIDVAAIAQGIETAEGRPVIVPDPPEDWRVNSAARDQSDSTTAWTIVYAPETGFLRIAQGFDADETWPTRVLNGADVDGTVTVEGVVWDRFEIRDPAQTGNVSAAMSVRAGPDTILVYGSTDATTLEQAAASVTAEIRRLQDEAS